MKHFSMKYLMCVRFVMHRFLYSLLGISTLNGPPPQPSLTMRKMDGMM
jgi:hypothetical protein